MSSLRNTWINNQIKLNYIYDLFWILKPFVLDLKTISLKLINFFKIGLHVDLGLILNQFLLKTNFIKKN